MQYTKGSLAYPQWFWHVFFLCHLDLLLYHQVKRSQKSSGENPTSLTIGKRLLSRGIELRVLEWITKPEATSSLWILTPGGCFLQMHLWAGAGHTELWLALPLKRAVIELEQECGATYYQTEEKGGITRHLNAKVNSLKNKTKQRTWELTGNSNYPKRIYKNDLPNHENVIMCQFSSQRQNDWQTAVLP